KALASIFGILSEKLPANIYETRIVIPDVSWPRLEVGWPRLEVGKKGWDKIFGKGYNNKSYLWFTVQGSWDATEQSFTAEIVLWQKPEGNAWIKVQPRLKSWVNQLEAQKFNYGVEGRGINPKTFDLRKSPLVDPPRKISAYLDSATIHEQQLEK